jgi:hypothetical protein
MNPKNSTVELFLFSCSVSLLEWHQFLYLSLSHSMGRMQVIEKYTIQNQKECDPDEIEIDY